MEKRIKKILHDCCISATSAISETGLSRNAFYLFKEKDYPKFEAFIKSHENDFVFTSEALKEACKKSGLTQLQISDKLGIHNVTLNLFIHGKMRPSRASGDYDKIKAFVLGDVGGCQLGRVESDCSLAPVFGGCGKCKYWV